jgi:hypothetical protein
MLSLVVFALTLFFHVTAAHTVEDDAYIHWRIAGHFLEHGVAAFNIDDPVPSSSSPLWIALLILVRSIYPGSTLQTVLLLNAVITSSAVLACVRLYRFKLSAAPPRWLTCLFVMTVMSTLLPASLSGMETPLGVLLFALGAVRCTSAPGWGIALFVLAVFTRLEFVLPAVAWLGAHADALRRTRNFAVSPALIVFALAGALTVTLFGTLRPGPAMAKALVYDVTLQDGLKLALYSTYGEFITKAVLPPLILGMTFWLLGGIWRGRFKRLDLGDSSKRIPVVLLASGCAVVAGYLYIGVPVFPWYAPIFLLPIIIGVFLMTHSNQLGVFPAIVLATPSLVALAQLVATACGYRHWYPLGVSALRVPGYQAIGEVLNADCPNASVVSPEIGGLGSTFQHSFVDAIGLASSNVLQFHPLKIPEERGAGFIGGVPDALVSARNPDVVLGLPTMLESFSRSQYAQRYERVSCPAGIDGGIWGNSSFDIYLRRDGVCHTLRLCEAISRRTRPRSHLG